MRTTWLEASVPHIAPRDEVTAVVVSVAGAMLEEHRRAITMARASARPPSNHDDVDDFVPGEANIFGAPDADDHDGPRSTAVRKHRAFDLDDGLVPSARLAMPEGLSVVGCRPSDRLS